MNLLNSPGGQLLQMLGVHFPGMPQQQDPAQGAPLQTNPGAFAGYDFNNMPHPDVTGAGLQAGLELPTAPDIPKPPHGGFFNRLMQLVAGGA